MSLSEMRDTFFSVLYNLARNDPNVMLVTADMGARFLNSFKDDLRQQYINAGVTEQNMVSMAAGLALNGKRVFLYGIVPFITLRCYEQIRTDLCGMHLPVTIVGVGSGLSYGTDGPTHYAITDIAAMRAFPGLTILNPSDPIMASALVNIAYKNRCPTYIRLCSGRFPHIYEERDGPFSHGLTRLRPGSDIIIISTGAIIKQALEVADELGKQSLCVGVVDIYRIKPLNEKALLDICDTSSRVVTLEENSIIGGLGSAVVELLNDNGRQVALKRLALPDVYYMRPAPRADMLAFYSLDKEGIVKNILKWLG